MEEYKLYNVERDGKSLKLKPRQLNIAVLSKLFHLFPESIVLVSDDGYVETPDEDGDFIGVDDLPTWTVSGDSTKPTTQRDYSARNYPVRISTNCERKRSRFKVDANVHDVALSAAKTTKSSCSRTTARDVGHRQE